MGYIKITIEGPSGTGKGALAHRLMKAMAHENYKEVEIKEINKFELEITADARYINPNHPTQNPNQHGS